jgi:hypothetical protein
MFCQGTDHARNNARHRHSCLLPHVEAWKSLKVLFDPLSSLVTSFLTKVGHKATNLCLRENIHFLNAMFVLGLMVME